VLYSQRAGRRKSCGAIKQHYKPSGNSFNRVYYNDFHQRDALPASLRQRYPCRRDVRLSEVAFVIARARS
jgi:hypothetical protein